MKEIKATNQLLISVQTSVGNPSISKGRLWVTTVQYRTFEYDKDEFDSEKLSFEIHDANCEEAKTIAGLVALE